MTTITYSAPSITAESTMDYVSTATTADAAVTSSSAFSLSGRGGARGALVFSLALDARGGARAQLSSESSFALEGFGYSGHGGRASLRVRDAFALSTRGGASLAASFDVPTLAATGHHTGRGLLDERVGYYGDASGADIKWRLTGTGKSGSVASASMESAGSFALAGRSGARAAVIAPTFTALGTATLGTVATFSGEIVFALDAAGSQGIVGNAALIVPQFVSVYAFMHGTAPGFRISAAGGPVITPVYKAYAVNMKSGALTEYTNFPFTHVLRYQGKQYALTATQAMLLEGATDAGTDIAATIELPPSDFGTSGLKRLPYVYIGVRGNEALAVTTTADETARIVPSATATIGRTRRAKMARGVKARFWGVTIANKAGEDFEIDSVELLPMQLSRKV